MIVGDVETVEDSAWRVSGGLGFLCQPDTIATSYVSDG